jgi:hypothetical protein
MNALWQWIQKRWGMAFEPYHSKVNTDVTAEQVTGESRSIITPNGPLTAEVGQWEVRHADGNVERLSDEDFTDQYEVGESPPATQVSATTEDPTGEEDSAPERSATPNETASDPSEEDEAHPEDTSAESDKASEKDSDNGPPL